MTFNVKIPALVIMGAAAAVLIGWAADIAFLKQLSPDWVSMKFNTAITFLAAGAALWLAAPDSRSPAMRSAGAVLSAVVCLSGLAALLQSITGSGLGIDQLFMADNTASVATSHPGRMSPLTALAFLLAGCALFMLSRRHSGTEERCCGPLAFGVFAVPLWVLVTYIYRSPSEQLPEGMTLMAFHTSVLFIFLSAGIFMAAGEGMFRKMVLSRTSAGAMMRKMLPLVIVIPVFIGWIRMIGQNSGLYGTGTGIAITAMAAVLLLVCVVYLAIKPVYHLELEKDKAERELRESHAGLEKRIRARTAELYLANENLKAEISQRETAETEKRKLQTQLLQAQKMEAVGRLAGGVAHDFNNILTSIFCGADFLLKSIQPGDSRRDDVKDIKAAAERAAALTRQLLAFSRKQVLQPKILDLGAVVADMGKMLRRVIGENIELDIRAGQGLGRVKADPGQMEQVIMNLSVNARDAMPEGGKLTLETSCVELDEAYARAHAEAVPGRYIMLSVSDTGCGMDQDVMSRLFEPFFTTKELGRGTGLGLATVYGIVKQSGGNIFAYSEPGKGTTFKIYLPAVEERDEAAADVRPAKGELRGTGTVLIVEDDEAVAGLGRRILSENGYTALKAASPCEGLEVCRRHEGAIDLMITDMVMPGMGGRELADKAAALRPGMKVIFISGYTETIVQQDDLYAGEPFLEKPFTAEALLGKVKEALAAAAAGGTP